MAKDDRVADDDAELDNEPAMDDAELEGEAWAKNPTLEKNTRVLLAVVRRQSKFVFYLDRLGTEVQSLSKEVGNLSGLVRAMSEASASFALARATADAAREQSIADRDGRIITELGNVAVSIKGLADRVGAMDGKVAETVATVVKVEGEVEKTGRQMAISEHDIDEVQLELERQKMEAEFSKRMASERARASEKVTELKVDNAVKEALLTVRGDAVVAAAAGQHAVKTVDTALAAEQVKADASVKVATISARNAVIGMVVTAIVTLGTAYLAMRH